MNPKAIERAINIGDQQGGSKIKSRNDPEPCYWLLKNKRDQWRPFDLFNPLPWAFLMIFAVEGGQNTDQADLAAPNFKETLGGF